MKEKLQAAGLAIGIGASSIAGCGGAEKTPTPPKPTLPPPTEAFKLKAYPTPTSSPYTKDMTVQILRFYNVFIGPERGEAHIVAQDHVDEILQKSGAIGPEESIESLLPQLPDFGNGLSEHSEVIIIEDEGNIISVGRFAHDIELEERVNTFTPQPLVSHSPDPNLSSEEITRQLNQQTEVREQSMYIQIHFSGEFVVDVSYSDGEFTTERILFNGQEGQAEKIIYPFPEKYRYIMNPHSAPMSRLRYMFTIDDRQIVIELPNNESTDIALTRILQEMGVERISPYVP